MSETTPKEILKLINLKKTDRARYSIYVSASIYQAFTKLCGQGNRSVVLEHLMADFIKRAKD